jgi:hypothetical protein
MGYRYPGNEAQAVIELHPVAGKRSIAAAKEAGLAPSSIAVLFIEGDNRPGLGQQIAQALADAGINLVFPLAHLLGKRYVPTVGFETEADAKKAAALIKKAVGSRKNSSGGKAADGRAWRVVLAFTGACPDKCCLASLASVKTPRPADSGAQ